MQPAKFSVLCLGFIALCIVTVAMVTAPFSEKRRRDKSFLTSTWIFHAPQAPHASEEGGGKKKTAPEPGAPRPLCQVPRLGHTLAPNGTFGRR